MRGYEIVLDFNLRKVILSVSVRKGLLLLGCDHSVVCIDDLFLWLLTYK